MNPLDFISANLFKGTTILAALACLGLGVECFILKQERDHAMQVVTSTATNLGTETANNATLKAAIDNQNAKLDAQSKADAAKLADAEQKVAQAQRATANAKAAADRFLSTPIKGSNRCERMDSVDQQLLEKLK